MLEKDIQRISRAKAKELGWFSFKIDNRTHKGLPDCCFLKGGRVVFIEFKTKSGRLTKLQQHVHKMFLDLDIKVHISTCPTTTLEILTNDICDNKR